MKELALLVLLIALILVSVLSSLTGSNPSPTSLRGHGEIALSQWESQQPGLHEALKLHADVIHGRRLVYNRNILPHLRETDSIELYHLRSFHKQLIKVPTSSTSFGMQTSGIALRSTSTGEVLVFEYKPFSYDASFCLSFK